MPATPALRILFVFLTLLTMSCSDKDYKEVSKEQYLSEILPTSTVSEIEFEDRHGAKDLYIYPEKESTPFKLEMNSRDEAMALIDLIQKSKENMISVSTMTVSGQEPGFNAFVVLQSIYLLTPLIIFVVLLLHAILLYFSLKRILRSPAKGNDSILHAIIAIFVPFIGPLAYLTTVRK